MKGIEEDMECGEEIRWVDLVFSDDRDDVGKKNKDKVQGIWYIYP